MKENMYYGASPLIFQKAEELRNRMTPAEEILWKHVHINEWKLKFRRQHPIANYVADFYCHSIKLVIELDGGIHEEEEIKRYDEGREAHLKEMGLTILRFKNEEVFNNKKAVLKKIAETIGVLQSPPSGDGGEAAAASSLYVIKIGGNIIDDDTKLTAFLKDFATLKGNKILIHGGGKLATKLAGTLGIEQKMVDGRRITDAETLKVVTMVYAGYINKNIVAQLQANDCPAIGITGADGNAILAHKRTKAAIDYGFAGDIDEINASFLKGLIDQGLTIVIAPITHDKKGQLLNTNADTIAQEIAKGLSSLYSVQLIYSFEKSGVLLDANDDNTVIPTINPASYQQLKAEEKIFAGMIPKLDNAFAALTSGVNKVVIGKAEELHQLINGQKGTSITNEY
ncbi:MAG: acetylglutamate kinase [Chitinophagaceae bacterium]